MWAEQDAVVAVVGEALRLEKLTPRQQARRFQPIFSIAVRTEDVA